MQTENILGNIRQYVRLNPDTDRLKLVRFGCLSRTKFDLPRSQLIDIAEGLNYLHSSNVVHGDLKGVRPTASCLAFCFLPSYRITF